jgi:hypothetical protein
VDEDGTTSPGPRPAIAAGAAAGRFGVVLGLVLAAVVVPFLLPDGLPTRALVALLHGATVLAALRAVDAGPRQRRIAGGVVVAGCLVATVAALLPAVVGAGDPRDAVGVVTLVLAVYVPVLLLRDIGRQGAITVRTLAAALSVYLLLGLAFGVAHVLVDAVVPDAYSAPLTGSDAVYLSFVTLTTVGYGDLVPLADPARGVAVLEAVLGQLYLVAGVALVVGNLGRTRRPRHPGR